MTDSANDAAIAERRKKLLTLAMTVAKRIGLTDDDRHELSIPVVGDGDPSWARMSNDELGRICDFLVGHTYIEVIKRDRVVVVAEAGQERDG